MTKYTPLPSRLCLRAVDFVPTGESERASGESDDGRTLEGYAATFDSPTEINSWEGSFREVISRGAFKKTLRERKPILQYDHGHDSRVGSTPIGKIESLKEDDGGLHVSARLFENDLVEPVRQAIEGGAISGMSFRFKVIRDEWRDAKNKKLRSDELGALLYDAGERGPLQRNIKEVELFELGPVAFPAYSSTSVGVRSMTAEDREQLVADYARSAQDDEVSEAAETFAEEYERDDEVVVGRDLVAACVQSALHSTSEKDDAAQEGTSSEVRESENPEDAAPFEGTSAGQRSNLLRQLRLAQLDDKN